MRDEKMKKKKAEEKAAKESEEDLYDEVFDIAHEDEYYGHLHDDAYMSVDASEKVNRTLFPLRPKIFNLNILLPTFREISL